MDKVTETLLLKSSYNIKREILDLCYRSGQQKAHLGGCMSCADILAVLYMGIMNLKDISNWEERDRFILSKGHCALAMYAALYQVGIIGPEEIKKEIRGDSTILFRHPKMNIAKGIECSGGSLGMGLGYGIGLATAIKRKGAYSSKVFVLLGDGECNEGAVWESAAYAGHHKLDNLTVIVDRNGLQQDGYTKDIINSENMSSRWESFGFEVVEIDGHSVKGIYNALTLKHDKPLAIIANTIKGKGISFAENIVEWHDNYLSKELYEKALAELEEAYFDILHG